jgi:hypothetical protein
MDSCSTRRLIVERKKEKEGRLCEQSKLRALRVFRDQRARRILFWLGFADEAVSTYGALFALFCGSCEGVCSLLLLPHLFFSRPLFFKKGTVTYTRAPARRSKEHCDGLCTGVGMKLCASIPTFCYFLFLFPTCWLQQTRNVPP